MCKCSAENGLRTFLKRSEDGAILTGELQKVMLADNVFSEGVHSPLAHLTLHTVLDSIKDGINRDAGLVSRLGTILVYTGLDEDAMPIVLRMLVVSVGTADVTLGRVADEVDSLGRRVEAMLVTTPLLQQTGSELKSADLGLAEGMCMQLPLLLGNVAENNLEHAAECAHTETDIVVGSRPNNIVVGEENGRTLVTGLTQCAETAAFRHGKIEHDLDVARPVARVGEDKNSLNDDVGEVTFARVGKLGVGKFSEGSSGAVVLDNIAGSDNVLEAVAFGDLAALLALTSHDEDGVVALSHFPHGCMTTNELRWGNVELHLTREVLASFLLGLASTIGEEDVGDGETEFILAVEIPHGLDGFRDSAAATNEDTVDIEGEGEAVGDRCMLGRGRGRQGAGG